MTVAKESRVAVVIVSWNAKEYLEKCLTSLLKQSYEDYEVIFVDNGSRDGSAEFIRTNFPTIRLLVLELNVGFAKGNNIGIESVLKDETIRHVVLLSSDTIVEADFLAALVNAAESDERVGSCQPKMLSMDDPKILDAVGITITQDGGAVQLGYGKRNSDDEDKITEVFGANAGAVLYKSSMLKQIGLLDEDCFAYYEDVDLALRARLAGWKCLFVPTARVYHKHSITYGKQSPFKEYLLTRNQYYYVIKGLPARMVFLFLMRRGRNIAGLLARMAMRLLLADMEGFRSNNRRLKAHYDAAKNIPRMFKKRRAIRSTRSISDQELMRWFE